MAAAQVRLLGVLVVPCVDLAFDLGSAQFVYGSRWMFCYSGEWLYVT